MTNRLKKYLNNWKFYFLGISSLIWFLIRVIPKPSRAAYPCMRAAAPFASSFILYLLGLSVSIELFRKGKKLFAKSRYLVGVATLLVGVVIGIISITSRSEKAYALTFAEDNPANAPMGIGKGVIPGRVVWGHNPDATNENYYPYGKYWLDDENTNPQAVDKMVSDALRNLTETTSDELASPQ